MSDQIPVDEPPHGQAITLAPTPTETFSDATNDTLHPSTAISPSSTPTSSADTIVPSATPPVSHVQKALQASINKESFEQEVGQVLGSFNSWWGGVKKQSASALSSIKADLDKTVSQAQADLEHLRTAKVEIVRKDDAEGPIEASKGKEKAEPNVTSNLYDRIATSTTQLQQTLQSTLQSTITSASNNPALSNPSQLRAQLAENLRLSSAKENLQLSIKQAERLAEDYLRKGDQLVKDAEKWMGDAVKVLPPEGGVNPRNASSWDGSDWYSLTTPPALQQQDAPLRESGPTASIVGSRKEALLRRLRGDRELLLVDPEGDDENAERKTEFKKWVTNDWPRQKKGQETEQGEVGSIRMALVPEHLTDEQFWQRYLFHKHMIDKEEDKRKRLLAATESTQQEDFSWDDEEDPTSPKSNVPPAVSKTQPPAELASTTAPMKPSHLSTSTSPRDSEESYDLVSEQGTITVAPVNKAEEDEDSDWE